uniref:Uncharacterized protein n=1 Tax=Eutreptiella gymnastica TaxID=73025 RepID=A0A7S1IQ35_9EUGL|mmetsp:Transcript_33528/g.60104  ORF Transcript_33528/g.60104 Transcript_33528/m.60104 type:complete len:304 (+) Transcript_33528:1257-2168(+)
MHIVVAGGFTDSPYDGQINVTSSVETYNPSTRSWTLLPPMSVARAQAAAVIHQGCLVVVGGTGVGPDGTYQPLSSVEKFDFKTRTWQQCKPLGTPRRGCAAVVYWGQLLVIGGHDGTRPLDLVERYDPNLDSWLLLARLLQPRHGCSAAVVGSHLIVIGGEGQHQVLSTGEEYNPSTNSWRLTPDLPFPLMFASVVGLTGRLLVVGGQDANSDPLNSVLQYTPQRERKRWSSLPPMGTNRESCATVNAGWLTVIGGGDGKKPLRTVEEYNLVAQKWRPLPSMLMTRDGCVAVAVTFGMWLRGA